MKKQFKPDSMKHINYVTWPVISEDGTRIAWVNYHGEEEGGTFPSKIYYIEETDLESAEAASVKNGLEGAEAAEAKAGLEGMEAASVKNGLEGAEAAEVKVGLEDGGLAEENLRWTDGRICLTTDGHSEKQPVFLKDGVHMAYLSDETGEYQVFLRNLETGGTRQITTLRHGVLRYELNGAQTALAFEATLWPEELEAGTEFVEMNAQEKADWEEELDWRPYYATDLTYKMDEWHGMRKGEFSHVGTVNLDGSGAQVINTNGMEAIYPAYSHDGEMVAFFGYPYGGAKGRRVELFVCGADGSGLRQVTKGAVFTADHAPVFAAEDDAVITAAYQMYEDGSYAALPWCVDLEDGQGQFLIGEWDESICSGLHPAGAGRLDLGDKSPYMKLSADGRYLYFVSGFRGKNSLYRVNVYGETEKAKAEAAGETGAETVSEAGAEAVSGIGAEAVSGAGVNAKGASGSKAAGGFGFRPAKVEMVAEGATDLHEFGMNSSGQIAACMSSWKRPCEIWKDGSLRTDSNSWLEDYELADVEEVNLTSRDKKAMLQYFLVRPAGWREGKVYPAVLDIKGGPETMYSLTFWHEFQALAGAGMAVIFGQPRGSAGFGRKYLADEVCWGKEAMDDLLQFVDDAVSRGWIDRARVGVTGGSYGGYMTNKLIGRTKAFAAAVTQRCLANTATSYGTGDMGFVSAREIPKDFRMLDYLTNRARGNIISYIDHFKVPLLILHAYEDYRCGFEQAEQVFIPMKERNPEIPVRLVMFPGENHGMTRTGKLHHQIRHLEEMVNWFVKYLDENAPRFGGDMSVQTEMEPCKGENGAAATCTDACEPEAQRTEKGGETDE
ncbi:MAG: S9 family peptidase [Lachnospiraceae bacterium]|nr:S9 family peptidase [Lachnospiraceae bacterium]